MAQHAIGNRFRRETSGQAMVELTVVLPLLLLMLFGAMEYGWLFFRMHQVTNAVRIGAREAALPDSTNATVEARVLLAMTGWELEDSGYTLTLDPVDVSVLDSGTPIRVVLTVPYGNVGLLNMSILPTPTSLTATASMAKEGP